MRRLLPHPDLQRMADALPDTASLRFPAGSGPNGRSLVPNRPHVPFKGFSVRDLPEQVGTAFRIHRTAFRNPGHDYGGSQASVILPGPAPCGHQAAGLPVLHNCFIIISALSGIHSHTGLHRFSPPDVQDAADFGETVSRIQRHPPRRRQCPTVHKPPQKRSGPGHCTMSGRWPSFRTHAVFHP